MKLLTPLQVHEKYYILKLKYFHIGKASRFPEESEGVSLIGSSACSTYNIALKLYVFLLKLSDIKKGKFIRYQ